MTIQLTKITDDFSTAPQISVNDMAEIAHLGFKTIINNRPDNEGGAEQPTSVQLAAAAEKLGLKYVHIPIIPNNIQPNQIDAFSTAYTVAAKPVLGFCRTGNRAGSIFKLAQTGSTNQSSVSASKGLLTWFNSKCLITRLWRWYAPKYPLTSFCHTFTKKG